MICEDLGGYELPLLVGPAVGAPLHYLCPVGGRRAGDVGEQSAGAGDDGVVAVAGGSQVPHLVGAAVGRPLLQLQARRAAAGVDVEYLSGGVVAQGVGVLRGADRPGGGAALLDRLGTVGGGVAGDGEGFAAVAVDDAVGA